MFYLVVILLPLLIESCSTSHIRPDKGVKGYFRDASECYDSSQRKAYVNVPTAGSMSVIEIPTDNEAGYFRLCMEHAGHPPAHEDPEVYLNLSRVCLHQARGSSYPDRAFAECIIQRKLKIKAKIAK